MSLPDETLLHSKGTTPFQTCAVQNKDMNAGQALREEGQGSRCTAARHQFPQTSSSNYSNAVKDFRQHDHLFTMNMIVYILHPIAKELASKHFYLFGASLKAHFSAHVYLWQTECSSVLCNPPSLEDEACLIYLEHPSIGIANADFLSVNGISANSEGTGDR